MTVLEQLSHIVTVERLNADGVPSASIALIEDGKISAYIITNGKEDTETVYQACSISKAITALAVAKLVDEGRFSYDTKVVKYLPQSVVNCIIEPQTAHLVEHVTVAMLLSHTSGLSQHGFPGYSGKLPSAEDVLSGNAPSNTPRVRFTTFPGAQMDYSGGGFTVLQLFLEHVTGLSFPQLMHQIVLKPLAMARSHFGALALDERNYAAAHYTASVQANEPYHDFVELAAAGLWTTPTDLLKAIHEIQLSLHTDSGFLKRETAKKMLTQVPQTDERTAMALGWGADDSVFAHRGGSEPGYACYAFGSHGGTVNTSTSADRIRVPDGNGIAVMTSSVLGFDSTQKIVSAVFYLKGWSRFGSLAMHFGKDDYVPYAAAASTTSGGDWHLWCGIWGEYWTLSSTDDGPCLAFKDSNYMNLKPAAAPVKMWEDGKREHMFVVDGLSVALRLTWSDDERVVELMQAEVKVLNRS